VYLNGANYLGRAEEISLPEVSPKMTDHKALGLTGEMEFPAGLQKMTAKIKWNAPYPEVMTISHDFYTPVRLMFRGSLERWENGGKTAEVPVVAHLTGTFKKSGGLVVKAQDNSEMEHELSITRYKLEIDGTTICEVDVMANIYRTAEVDVLANYRSNLGI
jgi:P2 family phage contractile tail tube protein